MEAYPHPLLNLAYAEVLIGLNYAAALTEGNSPRCVVIRKLVWPHSRLGRFREN
jgi:hypothetical protein